MNANESSVIGIVAELQQRLKNAEYELGLLRSVARSHRLAKKHIARLQEQNRVLAEAIADERLLRRAAWREHWASKQQSWFGSICSMMDFLKSEAWDYKQFTDGAIDRIKSGEVT